MKRPIGHKALVSRHHLGGTGTLGAGEPYSEWPSQLKINEHKLKENYYAKLVVSC